MAHLEGAGQRREYVGEWTGGGAERVGNRKKGKRVGKEGVGGGIETRWVGSSP